MKSGAPDYSGIYFLETNEIFLPLILPKNGKPGWQWFRFMSTVFFCKTAFTRDKNTVQKEIFFCLKTVLISSVRW
jgi:hypothetical protein